MDIPKKLFTNNIEIGNLYYFEDNRLTNTNEPHYFVVVGIDSDKLILFMVGTSQFEKASRRIELRNQDFATLVRLKPNTKENKLKKDTFIDCNRTFDYTVDNFYDIYINNGMKEKGNISDSELIEIYIGVEKSNQLTGEIKDLVIRSKPKHLNDE